MAASIFAGSNGEGTGPLPPIFIIKGESQQLKPACPSLDVERTLFSFSIRTLLFAACCLLFLKGP